MAPSICQYALGSALLHSTHVTTQREHSSHQQDHVMKSSIAGLLIIAAFPCAAIAQTPPPDFPSVPARFGAGHTSSQGGIDGISRIEGFIPLTQTAGQRILFVDGQVLLDNGGNFGGDVVLGYRAYDADKNRIWGGYVGFDHRQTDESSFNQIGLGVESLGRTWDFRANAYLPIGDTRNLLDQTSFDSGTQNVRGFQGHQFVLGTERTRQVVSHYEAALGGFDAEVGARLADWETGDLRGYGGVYFYDGAGDSTLGWRLRLDADPNRNINLGVALQDDDRFGTNLSFSALFTFPGIRGRNAVQSPETVVARLGEPLARTPGIVVDTQREVDTQVDRQVRPLENPEEDRPYRFQHVTLGATEGDGTFERPFGTMQAALNNTRSDGNDIVYVDRGSNPEIPAFTIPDRVQVFSQGPVQFLAGLPFPGFPRTRVRLPFSPTPNYDDGILVRLPLSGDGNFPRIQGGGNDLVTMGNRTTLAGFQLLDAGGNGIFANNVTNVELRSNTVSNAAERGISLNNVQGSVVMFDNTVLGTRGGANSGQGVLISDNIDAAIEVTIERLRLENQRVGFELSSTGDRSRDIDPQQNVTIRNSTIVNSREQGLRVQSNGPGNQQLSFRNGEIRNNGAEGVSIQASNTASQEVYLDQNTISNNGGAGIRVQGGNPGQSSTSAQEVFIRNNTIENNRGAGIDIIGHESVAQEFAIDNNTIRNNAGAGIQGVSNNASFQEYVTDLSNGSLGISNNTITGNGGQGIVLQANDLSNSITDFVNNAVSNNQAGTDGITVASTTNTAKVCVVALSNTSTIRLDNNSTNPSTGLFEVGDLSNIASLNVGRVSLLPNVAVFTDKPGARSCF
jgi:trimeric autotransporter adhesin